MTKKVDEYVATHSVIRNFYVVIVVFMLSLDMDSCVCFCSDWQGWGCPLWTFSN